MFLYEEVCFLKAEAALRGYISGDAKAFYEAGVNASLATWGVAGNAAGYLASTDKNLAGTSANWDDNYIKRVMYPDNERMVNEAEYNKGVQLLNGTDKVNTKLWWDKGVNYCTSDN